MKQKFLFAMLLCSTLLSFGQIESFDASQLKKTKQDDPDKSTMLSYERYPFYLNHYSRSKPLDLMGHEIYLVTDHVEKGSGSGKQTFPCLIISINKEGAELRVNRCALEQTYFVSNVLCLPSEKKELFERINRCSNIVSDTISYEEYEPRPFVSNKYRKKYYQFTKNDVINLLGGVCYELKDRDGNIYYISSRSDKEMKITVNAETGRVIVSGNTKRVVKDITIAYMLGADKFVSLTTYNYIKETFLGKPLVHSEYNVDKTYTIEKIVVQNEFKDRDYRNCLYLLYTSSDKDETQIYQNGHISTITYGKKALEQDTLCSISGWAVLKDKADSIRLVQAEREQQIVLAEENERVQREAAEEARHEAELAERARKQEANRQALVKKYGETTGMRIFNGEIWIGMTKEQCLESVGLPCDSQSRQNADGTYEIYKYNCHWASYGIGSVFYVHIINNKVVQIDR